MLQTAENLAKRYHISKEAQDEYGVRSQLRAAAAQAAGRFKDEIVPMTTTMGVADPAAGTLDYARSHDRSRRGYSPRHDAGGGEQDPPRPARGRDYRRQRQPVLRRQQRLYRHERRARREARTCAAWHLPRLRGRRLRARRDGRGTHLRGAKAARAHRLQGEGHRAVGAQRGLRLPGDLLPRQARHSR